MIGANVRSFFDAKGVQRKAQDGSIRALGHAAGAIRLTARRSIKRSPTYSDPGTPPHTRRGLLREGILYAVEKDAARAVIGPAYEMVGTSGSAHEFGGKYRKETFPKRAFMGPALEAIRPRLPSFWSASVK
jgi:hypothetical protein